MKMKSLIPIVSLTFGILLFAIPDAFAYTLSCSEVDGASIFGYDGDEYKYIGSISNEFGSDSIANEFGHYGNEFSSDSIFNEFSKWGNEFSSYSATNDFASKPPLIVSKNFEKIGYLTTNDIKSPSMNMFIALACAKKSFISAADHEDVVFKSESDLLSSSSYSGTGGVSVTTDESCQLQFGVAAKASLSKPGYCVCSDGWVFDENDQCVTGKSYCIKKMGEGSYYDETLKTCGCSTGYLWDNGICVGQNKYCQDRFGLMSIYNNNTKLCQCDTNYSMNDAGTACIYKTNSNQFNSSPPVNVDTSSNAESIDQTNNDFISEQIAKLTTVNSILVNRMKGSILLQVQTYGAAWYLHPITLKRYYLKDGATAYQMLRAFGLGVSETDYEKIASGDYALKTRLKGRIILRAQAHGEAYYINPKDLSVTYLKDGEAAYQAMRNLSLGITDADIAKIPIEKFVPVK